MSTHLSLEEELPAKPTFSDELWDECRKYNDFMPILFEWYRHIGIVCNLMASISRHSLAVRKMPAIHYAILTGLLNRCSRLMLANIRLSVMKRYGETTRLLDRSLVESAVTVQWLCHKDSDEHFQRYLAEGIKSDLKLKDQIEKNVAERDGATLVIEMSMLTSIQNLIDSTGLTENQIRKTKKLPDLCSMCRDLDLSEEFYIGFQRMGSHEVHGTWNSLINNYLRQDEQGEYCLRDHDVQPHESQFTAIPLILLDTLEVSLNYVVPKPSDREHMGVLLSDMKAEISELTQEIVRPDFELK